MWAEPSGTDIANFLELDNPWDCVMIQEVNSETACGPLVADRVDFGWDENCRALVGELIDVNGHLLLLGSSPWRSNGILVHRALRFYRGSSHRHLPLGDSRY